MSDKSTKTYLGDSVYARIGSSWGEIVLTTENGYGASNTIILEPEVYAALVHFVGKALLAKYDRKEAECEELGHKWNFEGECEVCGDVAKDKP